MFHHFLKHASCHRIPRYIHFVVACILLICCSPQNLRAQGVFGYFTDSLVYMPQLTGEVKFGPTMMRVIEGQQLFNFNEEGLFFDVFARAGLGRLSFRLVYEPRFFKGHKTSDSNPGTVLEERFEFKGLRLGLGADLIQRPNLLVGLLLDCDLKGPEINVVTIDDKGAFGDSIRLAQAEAPLCYGAYATYNAPINFMGMTPLVDASFRNAIIGPQLLDYKIGGGLRLPTTLLGTISVLAGYQNTSLQFHKANFWIASPTKHETHETINIGYAGWFIELGYIY